MHTVLRRCVVPLSLVCATLLSTSCTVVRVQKSPKPFMLEANGLIDGHAALGFPEEDRVLNVAVLGGSRSQGGLAEVVVWKLLRVEVGLAGLSLGVGPFHLGLGTLFYDPKPPKIPLRKKKEPVETPAEGEPAPANSRSDVM